ncbi:MAG TPA: ABC transporter permease, partial [Streptosporangiaceae bacterium]|nr:ABC transporter permease [Streptosporangiaceae bacterium]
MSLSGGELEVVGSSPGTTELLGEGKAIEGRSLWQIAWRRLKKDKVAMAGGVVAILLALVAVFAGQLSALYGHDWKTQNPNLLDPSTTMPIGPFGGVSGNHWLGVTPVLGQDVFAGLLYGARTSL